MTYTGGGYTTLLAIALAAIVLTIICLAIEYSRFGQDKMAKRAAAPVVAVRSLG